MKWLKKKIRNWLEVERSSDFYTAEESEQATIEFMKKYGTTTTSSVVEVATVNTPEQIHMSDNRIPPP